MHVEIQILAFDQRGTSAKELFRQLSAKRYKNANKRFKISLDLHERADAPQAVFSFFDGTTVRSVFGRDAGQKLA